MIFRLVPRESPCLEKRGVCKIKTIFRPIEFWRNLEGMISDLILLASSKGLGKLVQLIANPEEQPLRCLPRPCYKMFEERNFGILPAAERGVCRVCVLPEAQHRPSLAYRWVKHQFLRPGLLAWKEIYEKIKKQEPNVVFCSFLTSHHSRNRSTDFP